MKATATKTAVGKAAVSVTIRIIARIIAIGIVPVVWIGIVKERVPKITKEEEPIVEAAIVEPTAAKRRPNYWTQKASYRLRGSPSGI